MKKHIYGYELIMDLSECDIEIISSPNKLKEYVNKLCMLIKMKKYRDTIICFFGEQQTHTKGYSLVQLIETSSIVGHFSELWRTAYLNIFSCKEFDPKIAKEFTKKFFKAKTLRSRFITR